MNKPLAAHRPILWCENLGFLTIILLSWANEIFDLPRRLFGGTTEMNWREAGTETIVVAIVWLAVSLLTRKLLARLHYLEDFLRICSWCRNVAVGKDWVPIEQYFGRNFGIQASHGACPDCAKKMINEAAKPLITPALPASVTAPSASAL
jgi:hypothetical protein